MRQYHYQYHTQLTLYYAFYNAHPAQVLQVRGTALNDVIWKETVLMLFLTI